MQFTVPTFFVQNLEGSSLIGEVQTDPCVGSGTVKLGLDGSQWEARWSTGPALRQVGFQCLATNGVEAVVGVEFTFPNWSRDHFVLVPGAVYGGNRFASLPLPYAPKLPEALSSPDCEPHIANIRRLEIGSGPSGFSLLSGDMAVPAFAAFDPASQRAWIILSRQAITPEGPLGFEFAESDDRTTAGLRVMTPGLRQTRYEFVNGQKASPDRGKVFAVGDEVEISLEVHEFPCASPQGLFDKLFELQNRHAGVPHPTLPLSAAADLVTAHFNKTMWWPEAGLYRVWPLDGDNPYQTGWCGGIIAEYALLALSDDGLTRQRCRTHLEHALTHGVSPSGLLYGKFTPDHRWESDAWGDEVSHPWRRHYTLARRHGDALFYALKACGVLRRNGQDIPPPWLAACKGMADALCKTWETWHQWGQFLDQQTGDVLLGNSASGALIPAALVEADRWFDVPRYRQTAAEGAEHFYQNFTACGITTGGPGDALQAPDSESSYALVESYWALYELTGDPIWLARAGEAARQFASWVMPYDYPFPEGSEFHRLGIRTTGTIFANAQNAHLAPICTHSGLALFQIFRATGDRAYLDLLASITRAIPQLVSRDDRPILSQDGRALPSGWINERINTSDWDNNVGGVFYGPTWCEVALLLTAAEIPGIYARPDDGLLVVLDNVTAEWANASRTAIRLDNPTNFPAKVRILVDATSLATHTMTVLAGQSAQFDIK